MLLRLLKNVTFVARLSLRITVHVIDTDGRVLLMTICWPGAVLLMMLHDSTASSNSVRELLEDSNSRIPVDAGVCDADSLFEHCWTFGRNFLIAFMDIGLDHDTDNGCLAFSELITNRLSNFWLVPVVLL